MILNEHNLPEMENSLPDWNEMENSLPDWNEMENSLPDWNENDWPNRAGVVEKKEDNEDNELLRYGLRLGLSAVFHPFDYAKTLIQLGYEPLPPKLGKSLFGRDILVLPNLFQYTSYIRSVDGFFGCYRGLTPKLLGSLFGMSFSSYVVEKTGLNVPEVNSSKPQTDDELYIQFKCSLKRDIVMLSSSIIISHPLHVISVRMMAQFIGRETVYNTLMGSIKEIYKTEGIAGFFAGLMPKLLGDVACAVLTSSTVYVLNKYVVKDSLERIYNAGLTQYAFSSILYPLQVVTTCMCVTGSRLMAGQLPVTPPYGNMFDCWNDLSRRGELKRGSSPIFRSLPLSSVSAKMGLPFIAKYNQ